jgi:hypothetical protein
MLCPTCQTDNPPTATSCSSCQAALTPRRPRRRNGEANEHDSPRTEEYNRQIRGIFHVCLVSMIPFLGLLLGPIGAIRAWLLLRQARDDPAFEARRATYVTILFGVITGVSNWLGLTFIVAGLLQC